MKPVIVDEYVANGQVRLVTRHYAFLGPESTRAAEAAECAAEQDAFNAYSELLYTNQRGRNEGVFSDSMLTMMAAFLELDAGKFDDCLAEGRYAPTVAKDVEDAKALGVRGTPTLFVNGTKVPEADLDTVMQALEAALVEAGE